MRKENHFVAFAFILHSRLTSTKHICASLGSEEGSKNGVEVGIKDGEDETRSDGDDEGGVLEGIDDERLEGSGVGTDVGSLEGSGDGDND